MAAQNGGGVPNKRGTQTRAGDTTGRERERQQAEHEDEIREASKSLGMASTPPVNPDPRMSGTVTDTTQPGGVREIPLQEMLDDGLLDLRDIDPTAGLSTNDLDDGRVVAGEPNLQVNNNEPRPIEEAVSSTLRPGTTPDGLHKTTPQGAPVVVENEFRVLAVNELLEDVTIGKDNTFTFKPGKFYKVTQGVYDHLDEKGLVRH